VPAVSEPAVPTALARVPAVGPPALAEPPVSHPVCLPAAKVEPAAVLCAEDEQPPAQPEVGTSEPAGPGFAPGTASAPITGSIEGLVCDPDVLVVR